jgi:hypothetical protein
MDGKLHSKGPELDTVSYKTDVTAWAWDLEKLTVPQMVNILALTFKFSKKKVVGLERGPLSLVSTTEELLDRKVAAPV